MQPQDGSSVTCDIFCRVIDNFGDAGIAWRLARSLSREAGWKVRLVIDGPGTLALLVPELGAGPARARGAHGIRVEAWDAAFEAATPGSGCADVVVEAFSCFLPGNYEAEIAKRAEGGNPAAVFALDYLTAERYAEEAHGLASPHPRYGYPKRFFFPGFTERTGGLLREKDLEERRLAFLEGGARETFMRGIGADPGHPFTLYFFTYPPVPVADLAAQAAADPRPLQAVLAPGEASEAFARALAGLPSSRVRIVRSPMLPQEEFDRALWSADAAVVRGEDSAVRAQLAGIPLLWTLYPQEGETHLKKFAAFASLYRPCLAREAGLAWEELEYGLNGGRLPPGAWSAWRDRLPELAAGARLWKDRIFSQSPLTDRFLIMAGYGLK